MKSKPFELFIWMLITCFILLSSNANYFKRINWVENNCVHLFHYFFAPVYLRQHFIIILSGAWCTANNTQQFENKVRIFFILLLTCIDIILLEQKSIYFDFIFLSIRCKVCKRNEHFNHDVTFIYKYIYIKIWWLVCV